CPSNAISRERGKIYIKNDLCHMCGICKSQCPTQAININGLGEENTLRAIKDREHIIFSCSRMDESRTLKFNCLNGMHLEFLISLFIEYRERTFYFNVSKCNDCDICNNETLLLSTLTRVSEFLEPLGIEPKYQIIKEDLDIKDLSKDEIFSRRDLFTLLGKESRNLATGTMEMLARDDERFISIRNILRSEEH